ncbi:MAG: hypothetical protein R2844_14065 [Caldilineales bacterium]
MAAAAAGIRAGQHRRVEVAAEQPAAGAGLLDLGDQADARLAQRGGKVQRVGHRDRQRTQAGQRHGSHALRQLLALVAHDLVEHLALVGMRLRGLGRRMVWLMTWQVLWEGMENKETRKNREIGLGKAGSVTDYWSLITGH